MMQSLRLLAPLLLAAYAAADTDPTSRQYCFEGCDDSLGGQVFAGTPTALDGYYMENCGNMLHVQSIFLCARKYCSEDEVATGWTFLNGVCTQYASPLPSLDIVSNWTAEDIAQLPTLAYGEFPEEIDTPTVPNAEYFELGRRTIYTWYTTKINHLWYSKAMFIYWGIIVFFGVCANALTHIRALSHRRELTPASERSSSSRSTFSTRAWAMVRSRFLLPATFGHRCDTPIWPLQATIPPRIESVVIAAFVAINVVLCAVSYHAFPNNVYWAEDSIQIWRYFSDRTGYLAYANLAIFWFFGIRNNILLWLTGWDFSTFNRFHRWVARVSTLQAVLHSIGYTVFSFKEGGFADYKLSFTEEYWYTGVIATVAMSFLLGFSVLYLRVKFYQFFLVTHIVLALVVLVNLFYHTKIFNGEFDGFLWPCVAFWVFDRLCRILRIGYSFVRGGLGKSVVENNKDADLIRIDVTDTMTAMKATGGTHYFVYSPLSWKFWESHPFTLVRWKEDLPPQSPTSELSVSDNEKAGVSSTVRAGCSDSPSQYSFLIRPMKGFTGRLSRSLTGSQTEKSMSLLYEGAYGHTPNLDHFANVLLIIGGSGISIAISNIYDILERNPSANMHLVWAARNKGLIDTIMEKELKAAALSPSLTVDAFVTRDGNVTTMDPEIPCRKINSHRPNIEQIIQDAAAAKQGPLAVVCCGPSTLTDDVRAAVVDQISSGHHDVSLFVEAFNW